MSQVCVITGGTSGIGRCTAQAMVARGYTVYELSRRAEGVAGMQHIVADVTKEETLPPQSRRSCSGRTISTC